MKIRNFLQSIKAYFKSSGLLTYQTMICCILIIILIFNFFNLKKEIALIYKLKKISSSQIIGAEFIVFRPFLKNEAFAGYYSDKDLSRFENNKRYTQGQYVLAPTLLDINNLQHSYILFDCSNPSTALKIINKINAKIIKKHPSGIILAQRKI